MIWNRLAIGTANWGKEYNGSQVGKEEQKDILDYCKELGIDTIDTATAYEWDWTEIDPYFKVVLKVRASDDIENLPDAWCIMAHESEAVNRCLKMYSKYPYWGISLYKPETDNMPNVFQVPYSLYDRRFERFISGWADDVIIHVRSIFLRGKVLEKVYPHEAISFCLMNPNVNKVIIGVDSFEQLQENLEPFRHWDSLQETDLDIIDCRRWKDGQGKTSSIKSSE